MNRRNILKTLALSPITAIPTLGECRWEPEILLPFQKKIMEDIERFRHNIFIMPRASSKTWMCNYIVHDGNTPSGRNSNDRKINRKNRFAIHGDYFVYDELFDYEDFHIINKPIIQSGCRFRYKNDFYNQICEKKLVLFTSINNKKMSDILKTSKSSDELNIKTITLCANSFRTIN